MHTLPTRSLGRLALLGLALGAAWPVHAQDDYPAKPVTLVVPTAPSGGTDTIARLFADALQKELKQTFIVENKPGANGILGADSVAHAPGDGYRLLFSYAAAMVVNPALYRKMPYDTARDLTPVVQIGRGGNLMLVRADLPVKTIKEFAAYVKARPNKLSYCSWGNGSGGHLAMESFKKQAGIEMQHVPYKGSGPCVQDLIGGQVDAAFADTSTTVELVKSGRLRALANSGPLRLPMLPDVPTMNEAGYPFTTYAWYGIFAPSKTPPAIVRKVNVAVNRIMKDPAIIARMRELNTNEMPANTVEEFAATVDKDARDWSALVKQVGVVLD